MSLVGKDNISHRLELAFGLLDSGIYINNIVQLLLKQAVEVFGFIGVRHVSVVVDNNVSSCYQ